MTDNTEQAPEAIPVNEEHADKPKRKYTRRKPDTSFDPAQFEQPAQEGVTLQEALQEQQSGIDFKKLLERGQAENLATARAAMESAQHEAAHSNGHGNGHVAAINRKTQEYSKRVIPAGDLAVHYISKADNKAGVGIKVEFPGGRKPNAEEKEIIRRIVKGEGEQYPSGFEWKKDFAMWHKHFERPDEDLQDVPTIRIAAIRGDAERRAERLADALKQHQADPVGYREMVQQQRAQAGQGMTP
jgi:hypothetical protein